MSRNTVVATMGILLLFTALLFGMRFSQKLATTETGQAPTPTPNYGDSVPIMSGAEAVSRTHEIVHRVFTPTLTISRLVSAGNLNNWTQDVSIDIKDHTPVWIVGMVGPGIYEDDIAPDFFTDHALVDGAFYAWDATSGYLLALGVLDDSHDQNVASLQALPTVSIPISAATVIPTDTPESIETPTPET